MKKILLMARYPADAFRRQKWLSQEFPKAEITTCCNEQEAMWIVLSERFDLAVLQVPAIGSNSDHFGQLIRTSGYDFPIILSSEMGNKRALLEKLPRRSNMILMPEPVSKENLLGVAQKLLKMGAANQAKYPRFESNQLVKVDMYGSKVSLTTRVVDISKGGVKLTIEDDLPRFSTGDFLRLRFELNELNKTHKVSGQVVWNKEDKDSGQFFCGVSFLR